MDTLVEKQICRLYVDGMNTTHLGNKFGFAGETIRRCLHRNGVQIRSRSKRQSRYSYNLNCFSTYTIDSMYYGGLIMADGNVTRCGKMLQIEMVEADGSELLEGMREWLQYTGNIERRTRKHKSGTKSDMVALRVTAPEIVLNLKNNFGIVARKSRQERLQLPKSLLSHPLVEYFFRGLFDGDGCIGVRQSRSCCLFSTFGGVPPLVKAFTEWAYPIVGSLGSITKRKDSFWVVQYTNSQTRKLGKALYGSGDGMRMERKECLLKI